MNRKRIVLLFAAAFTVIFLDSCLTTGDRINMDEFKRQLEAGGQAMGVTQTAEAKAAMEDYAAGAETKTADTAGAAAETAKETAVAAVEEPAAKPAPVIKNTPVVKVEKEQSVEARPAVEAKPAAKIEPEAIETKQEPAAPVKTPAGNDYKWILAAVFAAAFALFSLIVFIISRKKRENEENEEMPGSAANDLKTVPEETAGEHTETASMNPAKPAPVEQPAKTQEEAPQENAPVEEIEAPDYPEAASVEPVPPPQAPVPLPDRQSQYGDGIAGISPAQFTADSLGNVVHLLYKVGDDSPEFRTIKITVPEGWSRPSMGAEDEGYFSVSINGGTITSTAAENMSMLITVYGLPAGKGEVAVTYGERRGGGRGVKVQQQPGEAVFKIETEGRGSKELKEILDSPVVDVN